MFRLLVYGIGRALKSVLELPGQGERLYVESLVTALSIHLLRNYCTRQPQLLSYNNGLPRYKLNQVLDYIHVHLSEDIRLGDLAAAVGIQGYFVLAQG